MKKAEVLELITKLPDDEEVDVERLIYTLGLRRAIEQGLRDGTAGREISEEDFKALSETWLA